MNAITSLLLVALCGAATGLGLFALWAAIGGRPVRWQPSVAVTVRRCDRIFLRAALASAGCVVVYLASGWPVAALCAAGLGAWAPSAVAAGGRARAEIAKVEAVATWTEQVRDTLAAANGLESAIVATARLAPAPIRAEVERLGARVEYERTPDALRRFANEVDHPVADFVVAALVIAAQNEARDLASLLGHLAATARAEARMRTRVWVGRARTRTVVRVIALVVPTMVAAVMLLDRHYFDPYDGPGGQLALAAVIGVFLASLAAMERMGRIEMPARFVGRGAEEWV